MAGVNIVEADAGAAEAIASLARSIWNEHYPPIIGQAQVDYMLGRFQSPEAIRRQLAEGYRYFLLRAGENPAGYCSLRVEVEVRRLFLSKLYVHKDWRGQGLARRMLALAEEICRSSGLDLIVLTVNRGNSGSLMAYRRLGFHIAGSVVQDIGGGFVMDDYRMEKRLDCGLGAAG